MLGCSGLNLKAALQIYHQQQSGCDELLLQLSIGFNTAVHRSTKMAPAKLFLGRSPYNPLKLNWDVAEPDIGDGEENKQQWKIALQHLKSANKKVAAKYNLSRKPHGFVVGDYVLCRLHSQRSAVQKRSAKLMLRWSELLIIHRWLTPVTAELSCPQSGVVQRKAYVSQLKSYHMGRSPIPIIFLI